MRCRQCGLGERCDLAAVLITGVVGLRVADPARRLHARFLHCVERGATPVTPLLRAQPGSPRAHEWRKWTVETTAPGAQKEPEPTTRGARREPEPTTRGARSGAEWHRSRWAPAAPFCSLTWPQSLQTHRAPLPAGSLYIPPAASAFQVLALPPPASPQPPPSFGAPWLLPVRGESLGATAPGLRELACGSCEDVALGWAFRDDRSGLHGGRPVKGQRARGSDLS